jgi:hypothetical protein
MSFLPFRSDYVPGSGQLSAVQRVTALRRRLADQQQFADVQAPTLCGTDSALSLLQQSYPSSVCMISRPLCGLYEPALGGCPQRYGNVPYSACGAGSGSSCGNNYYGRGGAGGWQQIGYLLPLRGGDGKHGHHGRGDGQCTCRHRRQGRFTPSAARRNLRQPSQFGSGQDNFVHEPGCALYNDNDNGNGSDYYTNREYGARRYHLYVRVNPDRLGQQCLYTSARRGDHRYNNCRYLQFGVSEEGVHDSAILLITSDYFADQGSNRVFNRASRCIEDGDILFVPSEGHHKFRVNLYDSQIYDGNC